METSENPLPPPGDTSAPLQEIAKSLFSRTFDTREENKVSLRQATTSSPSHTPGERFQYAPSPIRDVAWDWNFYDNSVWWSDSFQDVFGYPAQDVQQTINFWHARIHPDDYDGVTTEIHRLISSGATQWTAEYRFRKADGTYAIVQDRGYIRRDADRRAVRMIGSMRDVTQASNVESYLQQQTERLRLAVDSAELGTWDFDPRTGVLDWDVRCKELFGLPPDAIIDWQVFLKGLHPDDRNRVEEINLAVLAEGSPGYYDCEYRTIGIEDKKLRWIRAKGRTYFDSTGRAERYIGTVLDITSQKMDEQKLAEQEKLFRVLVGSIPQIVWTTDTVGKLNYISPRWEDYTGVSSADGPADVAGEIHADDVDAVVNSWHTSVRAGLSWTGEYRLRDRRSGEYRWFAGAISPLKDDQGAVVKWIGSAGDIHDQKLLELELEKRVQDRTDKLAEAITQLQQSNRELEQFAYIASHDLQEPLRKVSVYLGMLKTALQGEIGVKAETYFAKIDKATARMSMLIKNLLDYSRLDKDDTAFENVDLNKVVSEVMVDFEMALTQKSISLTVDSLPVVPGVTHQLNQLLYNLVGNAIKFSKGVPESFIRITYSLTAGNHRISIADNGVGFDQQYAAKMFEIFQRLNTGKGVEGHGIGLAICQKIIQNHRGTIAASGRAGEGAEFVFTLPVIAAQPPQEI